MHKANIRGIKVIACETYIKDNQNIGIQFIAWILRGAAQVMFVNNPLSGIIIFAGLIYQNPWLALNGLVGTVTTTLTALILSQNRAAISEGLHGYNGTLLGLLIVVFSAKGDWYWWLLLPVFIVSIASTILSSAYASMMEGMDLPIFTLPFNTLLTLYLAATGHSNPRFPQVLIQPLTVAQNISWSDLNVTLLLRAIPVGVGQVYGCDNPWTGGIIISALAISSPFLCLHAVIGSCVGILAGLSLASPFNNIYDGLWSYNAVLACSAIGGLFYALTWQTHILAIVCAIISAYIGKAMVNLLSVAGLPAGTWPFCLTTYAFLLMKTNNKAIYKMPLSKVTYPEANRKVYNEQNCIFQFLDWILRGAAQVMFVNNPLSGLVILIGLIVQNPWWALNGVVGTVSSTLAALILSQNSDKNKYYLLFDYLCPIISSALASVMGRWDLPVFTLPFNISVGLYMAATGHYNQHFPQVLIQPMTTAPNITWPDLSILMLLRAIPVGVGQVYGCDNPWTGGIFLAALAISSPIICLHAAIGSCVGILAGLSLASPFKKIYDGIWSYNCVLACSAIGGVFYALTWETHILSIMCAIFCAYLGEALMNMMSVVGLPAGTWPFCLSTTVFMLLTTNNKSIYKLILNTVTYPEENRKNYNEMKKNKENE
uniref:Solute carrier family 14 member 2 n=1 Tax=Callorhinchus milii TaxID=7868 RepID=A0A4W3HS94_CALMI